MSQLHLDTVAMTTAVSGVLKNVNVHVCAILYLQNGIMMTTKRNEGSLYSETNLPGVIPTQMYRFQNSCLGSTSTQTTISATILVGSKLFV